MCCMPARNTSIKAMQKQWVSKNSSLNTLAMTTILLPSIICSSSGYVCSSSIFPSVQLFHRHGKISLISFLWRFSWHIQTWLKCRTATWFGIHNAYWSNHAQGWYCMMCIGLENHVTLTHDILCNIKIQGGYTLLLLHKPNQTHQTGAQSGLPLYLQETAISRQTWGYGVPPLIATTTTIGVCVFPKYLIIVLCKEYTFVPVISLYSTPPITL